VPTLLAESRNRARLILLLTGAIMLLTVIARLLPGARTIDDAFITFRYSRNLVEGLGFVYNPSVHTLGTTTPLYTLLMAGISAISGSQDFPHFAIWVNALADAITVALLYAIVRRLTQNDWLGFLPALLWALAPYSVTFAIGGMETSVNILWMIAAMWVYVCQPWQQVRNQIVLGIFVALAILTRIDSLIWIGPLLLAQLIDHWLAGAGKPFFQRLPLRTWTAAALVLLPWMLFSFVYFGSPFPNSLSAKRVAYQMPPGSALTTLIVHYALPFLESDVFTPLLLALGIGYALLTFICMAYARRHLPRLLPFLVYPWLYFIVFAVFNPLIFRWYLAPPLPALIIGIIGGLWVISRPLRENARTRRFAPLVFVIPGIIWLTTTLNAWTLTPDHGPQRPAPEMAWHQIELYYEQMANTLREDYGVTAQTRVASADIGAVGYFSRAIIVDTVGLVTPELARYYPVEQSLVVEGQNYVIPPQLIYDTAPQYLITMEAFVRLGLAQQPEFNQRYRLAEVIPTGFYGTEMQLYAETPVSP
jgi:hypothetical protein